jgi:hypothetical protein
MNDEDFQRSIGRLACESEEKPLPAPGLIWAKAFARRRLDESERATRPIRRAETIIAAMSVAGATVFFPVGLFAVLDPVALWLSVTPLAGTALVSMLLLRLLLVKQ